jgi:hypothetical protein
VTIFRALALLGTLFLTACVCGPVARAPSSSPSVAPSATLASTPSSSPTPTPIATAAPTSDPTAAAFFTTHTTGWRPRTATLVVSEMKYTGPGPNDATIVAVPADGSAVTRLVSVRENSVPAMRPDGAALAAAVGGGLALWETSGTVRWIVAPDAAVGNSNPVWSPDSAYLYFGRWKKSAAGDIGEDLGIFRVRPDGSDLRNLIAGQPAGQGPPQISIARMVTKQNILIWGRAYEGASVEVLELATGRKRTYDGGVADVTAWRDDQPRALIEGCSNTGCRGLVLWNDETGAKQQVLSNDVTVQGADHAPSGGRIVVARLTTGWGLDVIDGTSVARIPGSTNAQWPRWIDDNIAYLWGPADNAIGIIVTEVRAIAATGGGAPRTLYRSAGNDYALYFRDIVGR